MTMGDIIRELRIKAGLTQEELGKIIGVQKSAIRKYESGLVENIKRSSIQKLAQYFNVSPCYLMGFGDDTTVINNNANAVIHNQVNGSHNVINESASVLSGTESELLQIFRDCSDGQKLMLLGYAKNLIENK